MNAQCPLVIIGATPEGKKELVGLIDGVRESTQSWKELLLDLKRRGLLMGPELVIADGALGFWQALEQVWPQTRGQRGWVHKTANVLNKLPKSQQSKAKRALQKIWMAETKKDALVAFDAFIETWGVTYERAVECLIKDRDALLVFYDFPAEHWKHLRTTNVIESSFATVRHRTVIELSDRKLRSLPPDPFRHQNSAIALSQHAALPDWYGGLRRRASSQSEAADAGPLGDSAMRALFFSVSASTLLIRSSCRRVGGSSAG
jgi:transposase-like protein